MASPKALFSCIDRNDAFSVSNVLSVFFSLELSADGAVQREADINERSEAHKLATPLFYAVARDSPNASIVQLLLDHGASPSTLCTAAQRTPLFVCVLRYHLAAAELLLASPLCDPDALCTRQQISSLHVAVAEGRLEFISALLRFGASPNVLSPEFGTPLHVAAARNHCKCARVLIDAGADVNAQTVDTGETPLMLAARKGHLEFVRLLLGSSKLDPYAKDTVVGHTALHEAALNGHSAVARRLPTFRGCNG